MENNQFSDEVNVPQEENNTSAVSNVASTDASNTETPNTALEVSSEPVSNSVETATTPAVEATTEVQEAFNHQISDEHIEALEQEDDFSGLDKTALFEKLQKLSTIDDVEGYNQYVNKVNEAYKHLVQIEQQDALAKFLEEGGVKEEFNFEKPAFDLQFEALYKTIKEKIYHQRESRELGLQNNLTQKQRIIGDIRDLLQNSTDIGNAFNRLHELQAEWRSVGQVPPTETKLVWDNYKFLVDQFYKFIEINKELKELDYRKNLELKVVLCEKAEALFAGIADSSIKTAVQTVKQLHQEWKEIGPVPSEHSEPLWQRFKETCDKVFEIVNESINERQKEWDTNLAAKQTIVDEMVVINSGDYKSHQDWQAASDKVLALFEQWKTVGPAKRVDNDAIWETFKTARTTFFTKKEEFYQVLRAQQEGNLQQKIDLCVQVESLQESTNWKATSDAIIAIQKQWKTVGPVPRKRSDELWDRFKKACDAFFNRKQEFYQGQDAGQEENLKQKETILEELKQFELLNDGTDFDRLREVQNRWFGVGFVPLKDKERLATAFAQVIDPLFETIKKQRGEQRASGKSNTNYSNKNFKDVRKDNKVTIKDQLKKLEQSLIQLETNATFFSSSNDNNPFKQAIVTQIEEVKKKIDAVKATIKSEEQASKQTAKEETVASSIEASVEISTETPVEMPFEPTTENASEAPVENPSTEA